jgi:hypothetical protein
MMEFKPSYRQQYIVAQSVQRFVELFDDNLGVRRAFLLPLEDALKEVAGEVRPKLRDEIVISGLLPHPLLTVEAVKKAAERQKRHSPLHEFLSDYSIIGDAFRKHFSSCQVDTDALVKLCIKRRVFGRVFISLCPNACFLTMSSKAYSSCKTCGERTTVFPFYCADKDLLAAWKENIFFEAWAYSLLKRKRIPCKPSITVFRDRLDVGEIDLLVDKKFIIEVTKGRGIAVVAREMFGKNALLGGGYQLMLLHTEKISDGLKRIFKDIIMIDGATSDQKFGERFLNHFK